MAYKNNPSPPPKQRNKTPIVTLLFFIFLNICQQYFSLVASLVQWCNLKF